MARRPSWVTGIFTYMFLGRSEQILLASAMMPSKSVATACMKRSWSSERTDSIESATSSGVLPERVMIVGLVVTPVIVSMSESSLTCLASAVSRMSSMVGPFCRSVSSCGARGDIPPCSNNLASLETARGGMSPRAPQPLPAEGSLRQLLSRMGTNWLLAGHDDGDASPL